MRLHFLGECPCPLLHPLSLSPFPEQLLAWKGFYHNYYRKLTKIICEKSLTKSYRKTNALSLIDIFTTTPTLCNPHQANCFRVNSTTPTNCSKEVLMIRMPLSLSVLLEFILSRKWNENTNAFIMANYITNMIKCAGCSISWFTLYWSDIWNVSCIKLRIWNQVSYHHRSYERNLSNCVHNCDDHSILDYIIFTYTDAII